MSFPTDKELKERYSEIINNKESQALSCWNEPNSDEACDDKKY